MQEIAEIILLGICVYVYMCVCVFSSTSGKWAISHSAAVKLQHGQEIGTIVIVFMCVRQCDSICVYVCQGDSQLQIGVCSDSAGVDFSKLQRLPSEENNLLY